MKKNKRDQKPKLVRGNARKAVARPEPPMKDSRLKRQRDRASQKRAAIKESY